jgi:hypothetical protein
MSASLVVSVRVSSRVPLVTVRRKEGRDPDQLLWYSLVVVVQMEMGSGEER